MSNIIETIGNSLKLLSIILDIIYTSMINLNSLSNLECLEMKKYHLGRQHCIFLHVQILELKILNLNLNDVINSCAKMNSIITEIRGIQKDIIECNKYIDSIMQTA